MDTAASDERQRRAQRLDGLGERVAAVAHEIKVPLSLIIGSLESLDHYVRSLVDRVAALEAGTAHDSDAPAAPGSGAPADGVARRAATAGHAAANATALVHICREGADRLERVVQEITAYARGGTPPHAVERVDVARVLRTAADLVARSMTHAPPIRLLVSDVPPVCADEAALTRVVVNLLRNACDALAGRPDPLVHIEAVRVARAGADWVEVRIADNGPGIAEADRGRVFEPFYSGKAVGAGLGLGLAIAKELVEMQQGTIALERTAPGTVFLIRLPVAA